MRVPEDQNMAANNDHEIVDMIFGGHDHTYFIELNQKTNVHTTKSGTDFECFTNQTVLFGVELADFLEYQEKILSCMNSGSAMTVSKPFPVVLNYSPTLKRLFICERVYITYWFERDRVCEKHVMKYLHKINSIQGHIAGSFGNQIEGRFSRIRTEESTGGNMCADLLRSEYNADIGIVNMGNLRANSIFPKGPFALKLIALILPYQDKVIVKRMPGYILKKLLENGISQYPKYDGRFLAISGIQFTFDPDRPRGSRILIDTLKHQDGTPLDLNRFYTVATKHYLTVGKDGFADFLDPMIESMAPSLNEAITIQDIYTNFLKSFTKSNDELEELCKQPKFRKKFEQRLKMFNASTSNRCFKTGHILICPELENRIVNLGPPLHHTD